MKTLVIITAAMLAAPASATAALSFEAQSDPTQVVRYDDLDLSDAAARDDLARRVASAVRRVCRDTSRPTIEERKLEAECVRAAAEQARRHLDEAIGAHGSSTELAAQGSDPIKR